MTVSAAAYHTIAGELCSLADDLCEGRLVCALEGGYDLSGLGACVAAVFEAFVADSAPAQPLATGADIASDARAAISETLEAHAAISTAAAEDAETTVAAEDAETTVAAEDAEK